ncbi:MAG: glutaredoxin domain-containing protein [Candidatus Thorarchaeota archaeon]
MILLFTSQECTWCEVLKDMLHNEGDGLIDDNSIYEVDIERFRYIAEAYGIMTIPTIVAGGKVLSGVPTSSDLRSFLLQTFAGSLSDDKKNQPRAVMHSVRQRIEEVRSVERAPLQ